MNFIQFSCDLRVFSDLLRIYLLISDFSEASSQLVERVAVRGYLTACRVGGGFRGGKGLSPVVCR